MIYLQRFAAILAVLFSLIVFAAGFPVFAVWYLFTGRDLTNGLTRIFPGKL